MRPHYAAAASAILIAGALACTKTTPPDAYGNVEATAVVVGAETGGRLLSFEVNEGDTLAADAPVGTIDSVELGFQRDQLSAQREATTSRVNEVGQQIDVLEAQRGVAVAGRDAARAQVAALEAQREIARRAFDRTRRLFDQQAATAQQLDQAERETRVLDEQIKAENEQVKAQEGQMLANAQQIEATRAQQRTAAAQVTSATAQVAQTNERLRKSQIVNPIAGTVLTTYAKAGEFVQPGQPLYKIANLGSVDVRAYVSEPQLSRLKLGASARVTLDVAGGPRRTLMGTVTWIASEAEFTPTPIQTREERADLVYALKIRVANEDGALKIGMPVDVQFDAPAESR